jgi:hypothetical protein
MPPNNTVYPTPTPHAGFDPTMPAKKPKRQVNGLLVPLVLAIVLLLAAIGFGVWAFMQRQDYKGHSDAKSAAAVAEAEKALDARKEAEFAEREKQPYKTFEGPATFGSVKVTYPKTWSAYVTQTDKGSAPIDGYFHPAVVPGLESGTAFALHLQVTSTSYEQEVKKFDSAAKSGKVTVTALAAPKVSGTTGVRINGEIESGKQGSMVLFPLRDKTLKLSTESSQFVSDFNDVILANLVFVP